MFEKTDRVIELYTRKAASTISRRNFVVRIVQALFFTGTLPLLPIARGAATDELTDPTTNKPPETGDPQSCDYWRYCAIDGFLSACCGGTHTSCPPGTEASRITWIGTCENPNDGYQYIISYNDCCGKSACGSCECMRNEGDKPMYRTAENNDINWCVGTSSKAYNSTVALILGRR